MASRSVTGRIAAVRRLTLRDIWQIATCVAQLARAELLLRVRPIDRVAATFGLRFGVAEPEPVTGLTLTPHEHRQLTNASRVLRRWPWDRSCLRRSLLVGRILRSRHPELMIGTRRAGSDVVAHAWVRLGTMDLETGVSGYETFR